MFVPSPSPPPTELYTPSLHDALPISAAQTRPAGRTGPRPHARRPSTPPRRLLLARLLHPHRHHRDRQTKRLKPSTINITHASSPSDKQNSRSHPSQARGKPQQVSKNI